jgi:hypothetical protein
MTDRNITTWTTIRQKMDETGLYSEVQVAAMSPLKSYPYSFLYASILCRETKKNHTHTMILAKTLPVVANWKSM